MKIVNLSRVGKEGTEQNNCQRLPIAIVIPWQCPFSTLNVGSFFRTCDIAIGVCGFIGITTTPTHKEIKDRYQGGRRCEMGILPNTISAFGSIKDAIYEIWGVEQTDDL